MFSATPDRPRTRQSRRESRSVSVALSTTSTQRPQTPPQTQQQLSTSRSLGAGLNQFPRNVSASPAPGSRRAKSSLAARSDAGGSVMDVDEQFTTVARQADELDKVLVKDQNYVVLERKGLPTEVEQLLSQADPYTDPIRASLDGVTGFGYLISRTGCYVWNWNRPSSSATAYLFPLPASTSLPANVSIYSPLSFAAFVPSSSHQNQNQREPGLLVTSTTGDVRYWESVSMALSGVDRWKSALAPLNEGELVRGLTMASPSAFLISTSHSRVLVVSVSSGGGRISINVRVLDRALGWAGSVWSAVFGGKAADPKAGILALTVSAPGRNGEKLAYAVTDKNVQVWRIPGLDDGVERLAVEQDLFAGVLEGLKGGTVGNEEWAINEGKVEIVEVKVTPVGTLAVLVSHIDDDTAPNAQSFAIVIVEVGTTLNSVKAVGARRLAYQAHPDPRPLSTPRLSISGSDIAFVVFPDAVVMVSLSPNSSFEEAFSLRSSSNRFLGTSDSTTSTTLSSTSLTLLTSDASLLLIEATSNLGRSDDEPSSEDYKTRKLQGKIEQAIFFGGVDVGNPLAFDLLPDFEGDLITAAEAVSSELLTSSSPNLPHILDLRAQLADRIGRARSLIDYINSNGLLGKLSQSARHRLSWDAEKLSAAAALWHYHNSRLGEGESLLAIAVVNYLNEMGEGFLEDPVRALFRNQVFALGKVVYHITSRAKNVLGSNASNDVKAATLQEANHLVLLVFNVISRHRTDTASLYGLKPDVLPLEAWSSKPAMLENLQWHFITTDGLVRERGRDHSTAVDEEQTKYSGRPRTTAADTWSQQEIQTELKHLASLADYVFAMYEERLTYLRTVAIDGALAAELRVLSDRYIALRPRLIRMLVSRGKVSHAYDLAERYGDFRSLVELCIDPQHGSLSRLQLFMQKYAEKFAFALYTVYIETGQIRALLNQDEEYRPLLTQFLDSTSHPNISWLNDIIVGRFGNAATVLVDEALKDKDLAHKKLLLSIGKLAQVAQTTKQSIVTEATQRSIEIVDDDLDLVNSQQELQDMYSQLLSAAELKLPSDEQGHLVTVRVAPGLSERPAFSQLHDRLCSELLQKHTLSAEDLVDLLTLKETSTSQDNSDFCSALEILVRAKNLPEGRKKIALQTIWRRTYLRNDWGELRRSTHLRDEQIAETLQNTALFRTLTSAASADLPQTMELPPLASLSSIAAEQLSARFEGLPSQAIDLLLNDFESENAELRVAVQDWALEQYAAEIRRLVQEGEGAAMIE